MSKELEKAIELHNQSRDILNNLLDKKLKEHSQYYWIQKGINPFQITKLTHQRDKMYTETLIKSLQKMI
jgi:hypothetical protein